MKDLDPLKTVALIGAGSMGARMASRMLESGVGILVCDTNQDVLASFSARGARVTSNASDCGQADLVIVMVPSDDALQAVTVGPRGACSRVDGVKPKMLCVMSTTMPNTAREIARVCETRGIEVVDAPVSGGPARAEDGSLSIFIGGSEVAFDQIKPMLGLIGKNLYHCGDIGSASAVKIINNLICITNIYITGEAFDLAIDLGVEINRLAPILNASTGRNFISADLDQAIKQFKEWGGNDSSFDAIQHILQKDLGFAVSLLKPDHAGTSLAKRVLEYAKSTDPNLLNRWKQIAELTPEQ